MRKALSISRMVMVYLLLGLVTTWAVAWGLAMLPPGDYVSFDQRIVNPQPELSRQVAAKIVRGPGRTRVEYATTEVRLDHAMRIYSHDFGGPYVSFGFERYPSTTWSDDSWTNGNWSFSVSKFDGWGKRREAIRTGESSEWAHGVEDASGFPVMSHWCAWPASRSRTTTVIPPGAKVFGGIPLSNLASTSPAPTVRALPYYPIWSGLVLNTAFYALLFFIFVRLAKGTRQLLRFREGKCPRCGYDLVMNFSQPCSECGHAPCKRTVHTT